MTLNHKWKAQSEKKHGPTSIWVFEMLPGTQLQGAKSLKSSALGIVNWTVNFLGTHVFKRVDQELTQ